MFCKDMRVEGPGSSTKGSFTNCVVSLFEYLVSIPYMERAVRRRFGRARLGAEEGGMVGTTASSRI